MNEISIGNLLSQEKGSAARSNAGKAVWSYMPLQQIALLMRTLQPKSADISLSELTHQLGCFQATGLYKDAALFLASSYKYLMHVTGTDFNEASKIVIHVWELGEKKYARFNWMKGMRWSEVINSAQRHIMALYGGEEIDGDSGEHHGAHLICNAMMLLHFVEFYPEGNDLPIKWFTK